MEVLHEWRIDKYGKLQDTITNTWSILDSSSLNIRILASQQLVISDNEKVVESLSLFNTSLWLKGFQKGDSLLLVHKVKNFTRKFRIKLCATSERSAKEMCNQCVQVLRQYMSIESVDGISQKNNRYDGSEQSQQSNEDGVMDGEVQQDKLAQAILGEGQYRLPEAYHECNYPTDSLDTLVRLCLLDPNFPSFVSEVEKLLTSDIFS